MARCCLPIAFRPGAPAQGLILALLVLAAGPRAVAAAPRGEQVYKSLCARCHGPEGEGNAQEYPDPLTGDRSVMELTGYIEKEMPEDDPSKCVGEDAKAVAEYIHEAFYSPTAQARNRPARVELARLTVRQYQNALADLVGSFRGGSVWGDARGLKAEYYSAERLRGDQRVLERRFRPDQRVLERIDPTVNFDFGEASPLPEKLKPNQFSIRWQGALLAPESGEYEIRVRTEHAMRFWLNDLSRPLIDASVKSGSDTEYRAAKRLLAGHVYPLRLDFSKGRQIGNDQSKKADDKEPAVKATVALEWRLPKRVWEPIPARCLLPNSSPEVFVATAPFPPDDRSTGYERGTSISKAWEQATTEGAIEAAAYLGERLAELAGAREGAPDRAQRLREFCLRFAERAFRRPLTAALRQLYVDRQFSDGAPPEVAVKRVLLLVLKSPRFLYREAGGPGAEPFDAASRLAFALWDAPPDEELLRAARSGELGSREALARQAERMLADPRARAKIRQFFWQWLKADQVPELAKDRQRYPAFSPELAADLRTSLELMIDELVWSGNSDFRRLLLADALPMNGRLAQFYGVNLPADAPFQSVPLDPQRRRGVLTHPYVLANFAYTGASSPIHRGVFITRNLLGRVLRPPPEAVAPLAPEARADLTTRQRVALQTEAQVCMNCHAMINPLGFTLEHFDAVGRIRVEEQGKPIDASGSYVTKAGEPIQFKDAGELAQYLAGSEETHAAFVQQLFHYAVKQPIRAWGPVALPQLQQSFAQHDFSIRRLAVEIAVVAAQPPRE